MKKTTAQQLNPAWQWIWLGLLSCGSDVENNGDQNRQHNDKCEQPVCWE